MIDVMRGLSGRAMARKGFPGSIGVRFMIEGEESHGRFSLVEHRSVSASIGCAAASAHA
jgi:hypothetical protein